MSFSMVVLYYTTQAPGPSLQMPFDPHDFFPPLSLLSSFPTAMWRLVLCCGWGLEETLVL